MRRVTTFWTAALAALTWVQTPAAQVEDASTPSILWRHGHELTVEGRGWKKTPGTYSRLPERVEPHVDPLLFQIGNATAGVALRFTSDATSIRARWTVDSRPLSPSHITATAASGVDLYTRVGERQWHWVGVGSPKRFPDNEQTLVSGLDPGEREYMLYLPLYNGVQQIEIGVPQGATLSPAPERAEGRRTPIVFYGTSITQGASASRAGMTYAAQLGRWLDRPVINLGFSGMGKMDLALATLLGELDAACYVVDCLPNMNGSLVEERAIPFFARLRNMRRETPVLLVEDRTLQNARFLKSKRKYHRESREELRRALDTLRAGGVEHIHYLPGDNLLGDDGEGTIDASHPTDLGMYRLARAMLPHLKEMISEPESDE